MVRLIVFGYWLLVIGLFLYSYTQVDLNLTLSQWSVWQGIQKFFQYIGWFNRPLSTTIYLILILLFTIYYLLFLTLVKNNKLSIKQFWRLIIPTIIILLFSYNAFSYDLFNYMFDARIVTYHEENPYGHKALDYPDDPWINFMRWTHRTYPYGPVWLAMTVPLSFIGMQFFLPTLFLFKSLMVASFVGTTYFVGKIMERVDPVYKLQAMVFFAFSPLVVVESLISAHHDIVMMFLVILAFYLLLNKKYIRAFLLLFLSIGIKFATIFFLPIFIVTTLLQIKGRDIDWLAVFRISSLLMLVAIIFASSRTELQPWYLLWILPFVSFLTRMKWIKILAITVSVGLLLHYTPFLYTGNWDTPIPTIKSWLTVASLLCGVGLVFANKLFYK